MNKPQLIDLVQHQTDNILLLSDTVFPLAGSCQDIRGPRRNRHQPDKKARREAAKPGGTKLGHKGHNWNFHKAPNQIIDYRPYVCTTCHKSLPDDLEGDEMGAYDEIDIPPITPLVRLRRRLCVWLSALPGT